MPEPVKVKLIGKSGRVLAVDPKIAAGLLKSPDGSVRKATDADARKQAKPKPKPEK